MQKCRAEEEKFPKPTTDFIVLSESEQHIEYQDCNDSLGNREDEEREGGLDEHLGGSFDFDELGPREVFVIR